MRKTNDIDVNAILNKFNNGIYTYGKNCMLEKCDADKLSRPVIEWFKRTPELCASMMNTGRYVLADVPEFSRVPDFFITTYPNHQTYNYLKNYSMLFDREFYKNLICSNKKALFVTTNIFEIMPEEYIDTEMIDLAIVASIGTNSYNWMLTVLNKKADVLSHEATRIAVKHIRLDDEITIKHYFGREDEYKNLACTLHKLQGLTGSTASESIKFLDDERTIYLPTKFEGNVPYDVMDTYDRDEYLVYMYSKYGIQIIDRVNDDFYKVQLPDGFVCIEKEPIAVLYDADGSEVIKFRYSDTKFNCFGVVSSINQGKKLVNK